MKDNITIPVDKDFKFMYVPMGITDKDYAAIHLGVPCSEKDWLNKMINASNQIKDARAMIRAVLADDKFTSNDPDYEKIRDMIYDLL